MHDPLAPLRLLPRLHSAHLPTPMDHLPRLGARLGLQALFVKRDDCSGLALGGGKERKLEFCLAAALAAKADCIVCGGVVQSNTARLVAAACARLGIECHLGIMSGRVAKREPGYDSTGNILLDRLFGAVIHEVAWDEDRNKSLRQIADGLRQMGRRPYIVPYGASDACGAMGYALAAEEIIRACPNVDFILHATGSGGTQAGLIAGLLAYGHPAKVIGIDVDGQRERITSDVCRIGRQAAAQLGIEQKWQDERVVVMEEWSAGAYGITNRETEAAINIAGRCEGLVLDPVYTGKAMAGLMGLAGRGFFKPGQTVVWIHTGGIPGLFAYPETMRRASSLAPSAPV